MDDAQRHRDGIVVSGLITPVKRAVIQAILETVGIQNMTGEDFQFLAHVDNYGHSLLDRFNGELRSRVGFGTGPTPATPWGEDVGTDHPAGAGPIPQAIPVQPAWPVGVEVSPGLATLREDNEPGAGFAEDQAPGETLNPPALGDYGAHVGDGAKPEPATARVLAETWKPGDPARSDPFAEPVQGADGELLLPGDAPNYEDLTHGMRKDYADGHKGNLKA